MNSFPPFTHESGLTFADRTSQYDFYEGSIEYPATGLGGSDDFSFHVEHHNRARSAIN